jgi:hypothetical protein
MTLATADGSLAGKRRGCLGCKARVAIRGVEPGLPLQAHTRKYVLASTQAQVRWNFSMEGRLGSAPGESVVRGRNDGRGQVTF